MIATDFFFLPGGDAFDVGYEDYLELDGSDSEDPDESSHDPVYLWKCFDSDGRDCVSPNFDRVQLENSAKINKRVATFLKSGQT